MRITTLIVGALLAGTACSGGPTPVAGTPEARDAVAAAAGPALQTARMQAGTTWTTGALTEFCSDGSCTEDSAALPTSFVRLPPSGLLLFAVGRAPSSADVTIVERGSGEPVLDQTLQARTTMAMEARLKRGRYLVTLTAEWSGRRGEWLFGVRA